MMPLTIPEGWSKPRAFYDANKIDFHLCGIMFWFMGGRVSGVYAVHTTELYYRRYFGSFLRNKKQMSGTNRDENKVTHFLES